MRALLLIAAVVSAGCGDDTGTPAADMTASADLSNGGNKTCGVDGIMLSCAGVSGSVACYVCDYTGGSGHCAQPCLLSSPTCPAGQLCHEFNGDGGTATLFAVEGTGCAGYGFCR